eukprot:CAMPEP_0181193898 /NCGR_PEP_ID=MMETSP1096-20121128/14058_1 /TAXON_ID=156174 ORGANISM="Chrysochromulina ericina, Strain CCMP281" /NCGR_SAMPLE_ID=MMETSP1096 /ASSEMBLY_ACC=CAM_ASM_000453 /LENGTH=93 /DNA_ID=CAMNT_0023283383 /DNA_START=1316 /DNA_END=1598 /DNA_ORIENTATION=+
MNRRAVNAPKLREHGTVPTQEQRHARSRAPRSLVLARLKLQGGDATSSVAIFYCRSSPPELPTIGDRAASATTHKVCIATASRVVEPPRVHKA